MGRASLNSSWSLVEVGLAETCRIWLDLKEIWSNLNEILFGFKKIWADLTKNDRELLILMKKDEILIYRLAGIMFS